MNANQIFNMLSRMVTHRLMNWGINKGVDSFAKGKKGRPLNRNEKRSVQKSKQRTRQALRILRRFGR